MQNGIDHLFQIIKRGRKKGLGFPSSVSALAEFSGTVTFIVTNGLIKPIKDNICSREMSGLPPETVLTSASPFPASPSQQWTLSYIYFKGKVNTLSCAPQLYLFASGCLPWGIRDVSKAYLFSFCPLLANLTAVLIWARKLCQSESKLRRLYWVYQHYTRCVQQADRVSRALGHWVKVQTMQDSRQICLIGGRI